MNNKNDIELKKYKWLNQNTTYGKTTHGRKYVNFISKFNFESLLDIGTGRGNFCEEILKLNKTVYGLDWAIEPHDKLKNIGITFLREDATNIPLDDKSVDITTSFDFLEHVIPENVESVIKEMVRVTKKMLIHSIAGGPSSSHRKKLQELFKDGELHPTQRDSQWWRNKFGEYCNEVWVLKPGGMIICLLE
jgi:ubiquinone/menaquinone biosynthesis C-methylase UbiE